MVFIQSDVDPAVLRADWTKIQDLGIRGAAFTYSKDRILWLSSIANAFSPAGLGVFPLSPLGQFDANHLSVKFPGHSYYEKNREVTAAIKCFLTDADRFSLIKSCPNTIPNNAKGPDSFQFITR